MILQAADRRIEREHGVGPTTEDTFDVGGLRNYDSGLKLNQVISGATAPAGTRYCLGMTVNNKSAHVIRPALTPGAGTPEQQGEVVSGVCPAAAGY